MEIITRGELPQNRVYRKTCDNCKTTFQFTQGETLAYDSRDQRDASVRVIHCPLEGCAKQLFVGSTDRYTPPPAIKPLIPGPGDWFAAPPRLFSDVLIGSSGGFAPSGDQSLMKPTPLEGQTVAMGPADNPNYYRDH